MKMTGNIVLKAEKLSKWYGTIQGVSEISLDISPGIRGLLGPNGAGKSTFLKIASGQLKANLGTIRIFNEEVFNNHKLFSRIGFCPEYDSYYKDISGWEFLLFCARLHGFKGRMASKKAESALERVGLSENKDKRINAYSLGMRQRLKVASSIIHDPELLILDEPLRGIDPLWRVKIIKLIKEFEKEGKTIIVSSHILPEIEAMTNSIILIHQGKIFAEGDIQEIRSLLDSHPHMISITCSQPRLLASRLIDREFVLHVEVNDPDHRVVFKTDSRDQFFDMLTRMIAENGIEVEEITSPDDNLQAVFDYLIGR